MIEKKISIKGIEIMIEISPNDNGTLHILAGTNGDGEDDEGEAEHFDVDMKTLTLKMFDATTLDAMAKVKERMTAPDSGDVLCIAELKNGCQREKNTTLEYAWRYLIGAFDTGRNDVVRFDIYQRTQRRSIKKTPNGGFRVEYRQRERGRDRQTGVEYFNSVAEIELRLSELDPIMEYNINQTVAAFKAREEEAARAKAAESETQVVDLSTSDKANDQAEAKEATEPKKSAKRQSRSKTIDNARFEVIIMRDNGFVDRICRQQKDRAIKQADIAVKNGARFVLIFDNKKRTFTTHHAGITENSLTQRYCICALFADQRDNEIRIKGYADNVNKARDMAYNALKHGATAVNVRDIINKKSILMIDHRTDNTLQLPTPNTPIDEIPNDQPTESASTIRLEDSIRKGEYIVDLPDGSDAQTAFSFKTRHQVKQRLRRHFRDGGSIAIVYFDNLRTEIVWSDDGRAFDARQHQSINGVITERHRQEHVLLSEVSF